MFQILKIAVFIPEDHAERMMDEVTPMMQQVYPGYDRAFSISRVTGTWRPLEGSVPFKGTIGKIETADELKIEFVIRKDDLKKVIGKIIRVHPYEEPGIDIIEMTDWHSLV